MPVPSIPTTFFGRLDLGAYGENIDQATTIANKLGRFENATAELEAARQNRERIHARRQLLPKLIETDRLGLDQQQLQIVGQIDQVRQGFQRQHLQAMRDARLDELEFQIEEQNALARLEKAEASRPFARKIAGAQGEAEVAEHVGRAAAHEAQAQENRNKLDELRRKLQGSVVQAAARRQPT